MRCEGRNAWRAGYEREAVCGEGFEQGKGGQDASAEEYGDGEVREGLGPVDAAEGGVDGLIGEMEFGAPFTSCQGEIGQC